MATTTGTIAALGKLTSGLQKDQPNGTFVLGGTTYTTAAIVLVLQSMIAALNASVAARATYLGVSAQSAALMKANRLLVRDLKQTLQIVYGQNIATLSDFGLAPRKTAVVSPAAKVAAGIKAKATREARHTMGSKQKAAITGATPAASTSSSAPVVSGGTASAATTGSSSSTGSSGSSH